MLCQRSFALQRFQTVAPELGLGQNFSLGMGTWNPGRPDAPTFAVRQASPQPRSSATPQIGLGNAMVGDDFLQAEGGMIRDKLLRPNLLESHTAIARFATSTMTRLTLASRRLGVLRP